MKDISAPPAIIGQETNPIQDQNCFALNYNWPDELNIPALSTSLDSKLPINIEFIRSNIPSNCLIVMIGGKYLTRINDIVSKVETVSEQLKLKTLAFFGEKTEAKIAEETSIALVNKTERSIDAMF